MFSVRLSPPLLPGLFLLLVLMFCAPFTRASAAAVPNSLDEYDDVNTLSDQELEVLKRASAFVGMRGKKGAFVGMRGKKADNDDAATDTVDETELDWLLQPLSDRQEKRAGFVGMRGRKRAGFVGMRGKKRQLLDYWTQQQQLQRANRAGFVGMRG